MKRFAPAVVPSCSFDTPGLALSTDARPGMTEPNGLEADSQTTFDVVAGLAAVVTFVTRIHAEGTS